MPPKGSKYAISMTTLSGGVKYRRFRRELDLSDAEAEGALVRLWKHAMDHAPDGDVTDLVNDPLALVEVLGLRFGPDRLSNPGERCVQALCAPLPDGKRGFLESVKRSSGERWMIADWLEFSGKLFADREKDASRKPAKPKGKKSKTGNPRKSTEIHPEMEKETRSDSPSGESPPTYGGPPAALLDACRRAWPDDPWDTDAARKWAQAQIAVHGPDFPYDAEVAKARAWESARTPKKDHRKFITNWLKGAASDAAKRRATSNLPPSRQAEAFLDLD